MQAAAVAQMLVSLVGVVLLIFACAWMAKRMPMSGTGRNKLMQVKASVAVGARERVVLLQVGGKNLLLGVAPGRINKLDILSADELLEHQADFASVLERESQS